MDSIPDLTRRELAAVVLVAISFAVTSWWVSDLDTGARLVAAVLRGVIGGVGTVVALSMIRLPEAESVDGDAS